MAIMLYKTVVGVETSPNAYGTVNPFLPSTTIEGPRPINPAWTAQAKPFFFASPHNAYGEKPPVRFFFKPSVTATTFTIIPWIFIENAPNNLASWVRIAPEETSAATYNNKGIQSVVTYPAPGITAADNQWSDLFWFETDQPVIFQVSALSSGSLSIYSDSNLYVY